MSGRLIVLEGLDGSGKATQAGLLYEALCGRGEQAMKITFPNYESDSSALVKMYLGGAFGQDVNDVNAYAASLMFSMDRYASYKQDWGAFYESGGLVIADRYTTSNAVHQASKLPEGEREAFLDWLFDLEYRLLGLPEPDLVLYLDMPTEITEKMLRQREQAAGTHADIHEQDEAYLKACRENARAIVRRCGWQVIDCAENGAPRTPEDIHNEVYRRVRALL